MARSDHWFDWHATVVRDTAPALAANPRRRLRLLGVAMCVCFAVVLGRCVLFELTDGDPFRQVAERVWSERSHKPAPRGRIVARDGTPLAEDTTQRTLAVPYRFLQQPSDARWLRRLARRRQRTAKTSPTESLEATVNRLRVEQAEMHRQLATLAGVTNEEWQARCRRIEVRVERMAEYVNRHRRDRHAQQQESPTASPPADVTWGDFVLSSIREMLAPPRDLPPPRITIREEVENHVMAIGLSASAAAEIEAHPDRYPDIEIESTTIRSYPRDTTAAHVVGYLGEPDTREVAKKTGGENLSRKRVGRAGVERMWEQQLQGIAGIRVEQRDAHGRVLATHSARSMIAGQDIRLTIDLPLQLAAEQLLDQVQRRRKAPLVRSQVEPPRASHGGGSIVVMDVRTGDLLVCASAPRFDPSLFVAGEEFNFETSAARQDLLVDPNRALFHRATQMALPPGSVFKPLVAAALLESNVVEAETVVTCRGYLRHPDAQRCAIFRRYGVGHGPLTLSDALARSCNVFFYRHGGALGPAGLVGWASRFGFGQPTGLDLPGEASGNLSSPRSLRERQGREWKQSDTESFAIGQGTLTATPLQVVRMMAAIATGGRLLSPRLVLESGSGSRSAQQLPLRDETLRVIRLGLRRAVEHPDGTAHRAFLDAPVAVAGKTGTAQTGGQQEDHAWFVGYAPAESPRVAFVVTLEHAGGGGSVAAPVARQLIEKMAQFSFLPSARIAERGE